MIIPSNLRSMVLHMLHEGLPGKVAIKGMTRNGTVVEIRLAFKETEFFLHTGNRTRKFHIQWTQVLK